MKIFWFDVETTGLDSRRHGIISLACLIEVDGKIVEEREFKMNPVGKEIDPRALDINGFTVEEIQTFEPAHQVADSISALISDYVNPYDRFIIGGYFVDFDIGFLKQLWLESGIEYRIYKFLSVFKLPAVIDPVKIIPFLQWADYDDLHFHNIKLGTITSALGIPHDRHKAMADIKATREVALYLRKKAGKELI